MNADAFRHFYNYHLAENRKIWDHVARLSFEQFTYPYEYSRGSVRDQIIHLIDAEEVWFCELQGVEPAEPVSPADSDDRPLLRARWDRVEENTRAYLSELRDEMLFEKPITFPEEDKDLTVWQVLLHVANHGTDHRAQLLRSLNDLGLETSYQDYIFYIFEHLTPQGGS